MFTSAPKLGDALRAGTVRARPVFCDGLGAVNHEHRSYQHVIGARLIKYY